MNSMLRWLLPLSLLISHNAAAVVADDLECKMHFHDSESISEYETTTRIAVVRLPEEDASLDDDVRVTRGSFRVETKLPGQKVRSTYDVVYRHAVQLDAQGTAIRASQSVDFSGVVEYPDSGLGYARASGGDPFDPGSKEWRPVTLSDGVPVLDDAGFDFDSFGYAPAGIVDVSCRFVRTNP